MRGRFCLISAGLVLLSGCGEAAVARPAPVPVVVELPAASAGGACVLLTYEVIAQTTGARFNVSAASRHRQTYSCVLRTKEADRPDLVLSVTATSADAAVFKADVVPRGGQAVTGVGKAAYRLTLAPGKNSGAAAEVGWLSADGQLVSLRYTFAAGQDRAVADAFVAKLIALAKKVDTRKL